VTFRLKVISDGNLSRINLVKSVSIATALIYEGLSVCLSNQVILKNKADRHTAKNFLYQYPIKLRYSREIEKKVQESNLPVFKHWCKTSGAEEKRKLALGESTALPYIWRKWREEEDEVRKEERKGKR